MPDLRRALLTLLALAALSGGAGAEPNVAFPSAPALVGTVKDTRAPLSAARVYAYQLADLSLRQVTTDGGGSFSFNELPAGLYKIIAFKGGYLPVVVMLSRAREELRQVLDLELIAAPEGETTAGGFWELRERIPGDVLRQIERLENQELAPASILRTPDGQFRASMQATAGVDEGLGFGPAQVTGGRVGITGRINDLEVGLAGNFADLQASSVDPFGPETTSGQSQRLSMRLENHGSSRVDIQTSTNRLVTVGGGPGEIGFESHALSWSQQLGDATSRLTAQYTSESNFHRQGGLEPGQIPLASQAWRVEGSYTTPLTERTTIQAGFRYRSLDAEFARVGRRGAFSLLPPEETVEIYSRGGVEVKPAVVVEYGLYSTLRDGSLSLVPQGGLVLRLGDHWRASTLASHRVRYEDEELLFQDFTPVFFGDGRACELGEEYCYQLLLTRTGKRDGDEISFGALHRRYGDTLRLYFNHDFFNRLESLFLVRGDRVPELRFGLTRRVAPRILTRLESNLAAGGGGVVYAGRRSSFENRVRYMVTSLDTRFERSETGVFLAFHRLEQNLEPLTAAGASKTDLELERLQVMLTQDLGILHSLASEWAVHVNMELSRGTTPENADSGDELRKRLTGGIAVKF